MSPDLILWTALLVKCEGTFIDLTGEDADTLRMAGLMTAGGLLLETEPQTYTLTSRGMLCLAALERFKEFTLAD